MKIIRKILRPAIMLAFPLLTLVSCYKEYTGDYAYSITYFSSQKPLRTVIADRDMKIKVGVSIGGKLAADRNDWAQFAIDPVLMEDLGGGFTLMPEEYYRLADRNTFRVSNPNNPIADVEISFTEAFYADPQAALRTYAIPFRITESSLDSIHRGQYDVGGNELIPRKDYSIVVVKYVSTFSGTYYAHGKIEELGASGEVVNTVIYKDVDMSDNIERELSTVSTHSVLRPGLGNMAITAAENVLITVGADSRVELSAPDGSLAISDTSGEYFPDREKPEFELKYTYVKNAKTYRVAETLTLRQDPLKDLRFEEW